VTDVINGKRARSCQGSRRNKSSVIKESRPVWNWPFCYGRKVESLNNTKGEEKW